MAEIVEFEPELEFPRILSRLEASERVKVASKKELSKYFTPPSRDYTDPEVLFRPHYPYEANIIIGSVKSAFTHEEIDDLNNYLIRLIGRPEFGRGTMMHMLPFDDLDWKNNIHHSLGRKSLVYDDDTEIVKEMLQGKTVIIPGSMHYVRRIGTVKRPAHYDFTFNGLGIEGGFRKKGPTSTKKIKGSMIVEVYPSIDYAVQASKGFPGSADASIIVVP